MLSKYKIVVFHLGWIFTLIVSTAFLCTFIFSDNQVKPEEPISIEQIFHSNSARTIWKRGKYPSTTTIQEKASKSSVTDKKSHSSSGWTTIKWRKGDT